MQSCSFDTRRKLVVQLVWSCVSSCLACLLLCGRLEKQFISAELEGMFKTLTQFGPLLRSFSTHPLLCFRGHLTIGGWILWPSHADCASQSFCQAGLITLAEASHAQKNKCVQIYRKWLCFFSLKMLSSTLFFLFFFNCKAVSDHSPASAASFSPWRTWRTRSVRRRRRRWRWAPCPGCLLGGSSASHWTRACSMVQPPLIIT